MNPDVAVGYLQIGIAVILAFLGGFVLIKRPESQQLTVQVSYAE